MLRFSRPGLLLASLEVRAGGFFLPGSMAFYLDEDENHAMSNFEVGALLHTHTH